MRQSDREGIPGRSSSGRRIDIEPESAGPNRLTTPEHSSSSQRPSLPTVRLRSTHVERAWLQFDIRIVEDRARARGRPAAASGDVLDVAVAPDEVVQRRSVLEVRLQ